LTVFSRKMFQDILTDKQKEMLPMVKAFSNEFYLVGGTAFALQLGHRRSVDFDLFTYGRVDVVKTQRKINRFYQNTVRRYKDENEYTVIINTVKTTFYDFPFKVPAEVDFNGIIFIPNILTLTAMKAFAIGQRAKWKDYVDISFALKTYSIQDIADRARTLFGGEFNERLFRSELGYFDDVDYSEEVEFMPGFEVSMDEVKSTLADLSTQI